MGQSHIDTIGWQIIAEEKKEKDRKKNAREQIEK